MYSELDMDPESEPVNFSPSPDFQWLCDELFVKLEDAISKKIEFGKPRKLRYLEVISYFLKLWRTTVGNDIYPVLLLCLPYRDKRSYRIKEVTLVLALCKYLQLPRNSDTQKRLLTWKQNAPRGSKLSTFCVEELRKRRKEPSKRKKLSIDEVNECLNKLEHDSNVGKWGFTGLSESETFRFCLENMSHTELRYFFDILLKVSIVGGMESLLFKCWHPDAENYFKVVSDLKVVAKTLWDPKTRLQKNDLSVHMGFPFAPQLAYRFRLSYEKIAQKLENDFLIEEKMDGERIQLHYMNFGESVSYWSRNGINYTHLYGENIQKGSISKYLKFIEGVKECILDGEMISYDQELKCILPFGLTKSGASDKINFEVTGEEEVSYRPLFMVFDLVYLNGQALTRQKLYDRKEYLEKILIPSKNIVEILPFTRCNNSDSITASLRSAISHGSEGIILKNVNSIYSVGKRNETWVKIKPEYLENFGENMDLVVVGRDRGKKDSFLCALVVTEPEERPTEELPTEDCDPEEDLEDSVSISEPKIKKFISFCNIANGISYEEFKEIDRLTRGKWVRYDDVKPPEDWLEFGTKTPYEWIDPKDSIVLEVKARSIDNGDSKKDKYKTGSTLHGAYCRQIRRDKDWSTACTVQEYKTARIAKNRYLYNSQDDNLMKARKSPRKRRSFHLVGDIKKELPVKASFFKGYYFYVTGGYFDAQLKKRVDVSDIAEAIVTHGGTYVHNLQIRAGTGHLYIFGGKMTRECRLLIERGYDIIHPSWIMDCIMLRTLLKIEPRHIYNVTTQFMSNVSKRLDQFEDSYQIPIDEQLYDNVVKNYFDSDQSLDTDTFDSSEDLSFPPFQNWSIYIVADNPFYWERTALMDFKINHYGGKITKSLKDANLIVAIEGAYSKEGLQKIRKELASRVTGNEPQHPIAKITTDKWINKCIEEGYLVDEDDYPAL